MQIEKVAECVMVVLELESGKVAIKCGQQLLGVHIRWWNRCASVEDFLHDLF
jgi:hypothetical protein